MKDKLENYIENHRDEFDIFEPSNDLWDKIKTDKQKTRIIRLNTRIIWRAAAVVAIFLTGYLIQEFRYQAIISNTNPVTAQVQNEGEVEIPELKETEAYFAHQVSSMMIEVEKYSVCDPEIVEDVQLDLNELDSIYSELKHDLKDNVANGEVVEAMIQNYRMKIKILEDLLTELKEIDNDCIEKQNIDYEL